VSKLIVFGIDGGSLKLIEQWKEELPNLRRFMEGGVFGELESTIPPVTCPAWPCMFTGKNPGKLGMYGFLRSQFRGEHGFEVFNSRDYHSSSLWKILNDYGKEVGLLNVPMTFPPHKINSFMVCGLGTPQRADYTYPPELKKTLDKLVGGYEVFPPVILTRYRREKEYLKLFNELLDKRGKTASYLINNLPWELFVCVFLVSDLAQHYFWHHMDASHPRHVDDSKYKDAIKHFYKRIDEAVGVLISQIPEDVNILVVSDHGFGPAYGSFSLNKWLQENGFLKFKDGSKGVINAGLNRIIDFILSRLNSRVLRLVTTVIPPSLANRLSNVERDKMLESEVYRKLDWSQTKAYGLGEASGIFISLKGREPDGIVQSGREYERVRDEIIEKLGKVVNPETGEPLGFQIFKKEDIYHGQHVNLAPDILIVWNKYYPVSHMGKSQWSEPVVPGIHTRQGVLMAYGPDIRSEGLRLTGSRIYDITPTILHLLGLPISKDMDGRVLTEIFKSGSEPAKRAVTYEKLREGIKSRISQLKASGRLK